ncbi:MAG: UvrB/UvrC motif-containing protein, partial [Spirochaetia bacterium]|nr:UvrB/UvrC motif-containing protein [Spirochaetia bacterium]
VYQKMLEDAVREDRFEDAARLRNQIEIMMGKLN